MNKEYSIQLAELEDLDSWMEIVEIVKDNFPGLNTPEDLADYKNTVIKNINRQTAIVAKSANDVVGVLIFSYKSKCISCMAVHPDHRRHRIATGMIELFLSLYPQDIDLSVTTFREGDEKGVAPRKLYKKFGFVEDKLVMDFNYPHQVFVLRRK